MATKRMLIDAAHSEEIRVAVMDGNQLEELDVESAARRQLKGNIYLAKVTRVEPSLQAAFVDYGGNRHGFLAFSEIHPDYYQIPVADREELLAEESAASENDDADDDIDEETGANGNDQENDGKTVETVGGDDIDEVETRRKFFPAKRYKIQEVIKRRQILLVQVVKEERGNKGAALTTYMSLAGRYCVLMPNTGKGGGISRKISNGSDRKRLKTIISDFDIPDGMAVIVRTAGADRSKAEIKRDYEYLIKLWSSVRDLTLESTAPAMIHEEASIIKRAVRDHYSRDVAEVIVEGEEGYRTAKDLMKMLIPSHAKKVQPYKDTTVPLFNRYHIESQLETMNSANVQLKSGGYIVINITEALVAVDVNSGRATRGRNIEETALKTNLEAANEVARQLRLRDLAGLVVIDFIDMEIHRNQTAVEHRLKEAMRKDRARIQIGRISPFGLLELSRQRLRPSITETMTEVCPHCGGSGIRRSIESTALHVLRGIEEEGARQRAKEMEVFVHSQVALYILNEKRDAVAEIEQKFEIKVVIMVDDGLIPPDFNINRTVTNKQANAKAKSSGSKASGPEADESSEDQPKRKRRRRSKHRNRDKDEGAAKSPEGQAAADEAETGDSGDTTAEATQTDEEKSDKPARRHRGRRGGHRRNRRTKAASETSSEDTSKTTSESTAEESSDDNNITTDDTEAKSPKDKKVDQKTDRAGDKTKAGAKGEKEKPKRRRRV
ncbi:MAG: Rne/Rng family ribonuclease, partial [Rhodospirillales bacterium]|nr:Rne/Rng family ribonuclease [Rhodospirillales bacterium]